MEQKKIIVAIDGHSSSGKSTMAKRLAAEVGYVYVDTGAMYRAFALHCVRLGVMDEQNIEEPKIPEVIGKTAISFAIVDGRQHTLLNGEDVESEIRTLRIGNCASRISALPIVREAMVNAQQKMGMEKGIIMDGRDIGTVVFPSAEMKVYVTASEEVRAERRFLELKAKGEQPTMEAVLADVRDRDYRDTHRAVGPLKKADDAFVLDNTYLNQEEQYTLLRLYFKSLSGL
ncbi:MAG: (d)CMP kinase [Paludibacteraceae bacterium]|nr:(d)CMP kinase [Paludibacteraceae bacterium]